MTETITFGKTTAPAIKSGRSIEPNPFDGHFPTAVTKDDKGEVVEREALTVEYPGTPEDNKAKVTNLTGKARRCAEKLTPPMTARVQVNAKEDDKGKPLTGKNAVTVVTIWTVDKITRQSADQTADGQPATE